MLTEKEYRIVESVMRSTEFSEACFLDYRESLEERVKDDRIALSSVGITTKQIADILNSVLTLFKREIEPLGKLIRDEEELRRTGWVRREHKRRWRESIVCKRGIKYRLTGSAYCGSQECPYSCLPTFSSCEKVSIGNCDLCLEKFEKDKMVDKLQFGSLLPHLIGAHEFFEGNGMRYRLDPLHVFKFFAMSPGVDYTAYFQEDDVEIASRYATS